MKITVRHNNTEIIYEDAQRKDFPIMAHSTSSFDALIQTIGKMAEEVRSISPIITVNNSVGDDIMLLREDETSNHYYISYSYRTEHDVLEVGGGVVEHTGTVDQKFIEDMKGLFEERLACDGRVTILGIVPIRVYTKPKD